MNSWDHVLSLSCGLVQKYVYITYCSPSVTFSKICSVFLNECNSFMFAVAAEYHDSADYMPISSVISALQTAIVLWRPLIQFASLQSHAMASSISWRCYNVLPGRTPTRGVGESRLRQRLSATVCPVECSTVSDGDSTPPALALTQQRVLANPISGVDWSEDWTALDFTGLHWRLDWDSHVALSHRVSAA